MLKKIVGLLALLILVFCVVAAMQPDDFRYSRSTVISSPPAPIFEIVNTQSKWEAWSPWAKIDPQMQKTLSGPAAGVGSKYTWSGNSEVGEGSSTIVESVPNERIAMKLEFVRPFSGVNDVYFTLEPQGNETKVTWTMAGKNTFLSKAVGLLMNCEKMLGEQFDTGLAQLKALVEKPV
ncbi:MAG: SRPBCC family protein [Deltaproteobacteria bacterium]|nr:SRPBCC family protein [Deltaproteobacteria bacterium]